MLIFGTDDNFCIVFYGRAERKSGFDNWKANELAVHRVYNEVKKADPVKVDPACW